ncbi:hypothetical protein K501DRAFT_304114 [Backusella circina FSU 941]|nr:hypothetical protein K501DRAFT_304114 [Backusella circina FSU 941]
MYVDTVIVPAPNVHIGTLVMYSLLFVLCIYSYYTRSPREINRTLHLTLIVSLCGVMNAALYLGSHRFVTFHWLGQMQAAAQFFGLILASLTWMVGITSFSVVLKKQDKRPIQVLLAYFLTFVLFALSIAYEAIIGRVIQTNGFDNFEALRSASSKIFISIISLDWGFLLLFVSLFMQYRQSLSRTVMVTLAIFCIMNTVSLIVGTDMRVSSGYLGIANEFYLLFFFTDFVPSLSLYMTTIYWKDMNKSEEQ